MHPPDPLSLFSHDSLATTRCLNGFTRPSKSIGILSSKHCMFSSRSTEAVELVVSRDTMKNDYAFLLPLLLSETRGSYFFILCVLNGDIAFVLKRKGSKKKKKKTKWHNNNPSKTRRQSGFRSNASPLFTCMFITCPSLTLSCFLWKTLFFSNS